MRNGNYNFLDKHNPKLTSSDKRKIYLQNFRAHTFLSGVNAVTQDGELFLLMDMEAGQLPSFMDQNKSF